MGLPYSGCHLCSSESCNRLLYLPRNSHATYLTKARHLKKSSLNNISVILLHVCYSTTTSFLVLQTFNKLTTSFKHTSKLTRITTFTIPTTHNLIPTLIRDTSSYFTLLRVDHSAIDKGHK